MQAHQQLERALISYTDYVEALSAFQGRDQRDLNWEPMRATVRDAKDKLQLIETAKSTVDRIWGSQLQQLCDTTTWSYYMWEHVRKAAQKVQDAQQARRLLNQAISLRLTAGRRGVSSRTTVPQPMDFKMIAEHGNPGAHQLSEQELTNDELSHASLTFNTEGTLVYAVVPVLGTGWATTVFEGPGVESEEPSGQLVRIASDVSMREVGPVSPMRSPQ